jgi:dTMP kinase
MLMAIEGIDGSGKGTQAARLVDQLREQGLRAALLSFPRYQHTRFGRQIGRFLNGEFGSLETIHPVLVSLLFAGDRGESRSVLQDALANHEIVVCDRYVGSNLAHQGAKAPLSERADVLEWIEFVEFELLQLPRPDLVVWLDLPVPVAQQLIGKKAPRSYTDRRQDLQEADGSYLEAVRQTYRQLASNDPCWRSMEVCPHGVLRSVESVSRELITLVLETYQQRRAQNSPS